MTQNEQILAILKRGRCITQLDAYARIGCTRLAARIAELRAAGYAIDSKRVRVRTRNGHARIAVYRML